MPTNIIAVVSVVLVTNVVEMFHPSGTERVVSTNISEIHTITYAHRGEAFVVTNVVGVASNGVTFRAATIWTMAPPKPIRSPLSIRDFPPLPGSASITNSANTNK